MVTVEQLEELGVDVEDTLDRFGGNVDLLERMIRLFADNNTLDEMLAAYEAQIPDDLERSSHSIKGSSANLGFKELSSRASDVCEYVRATHTSQVPQDMIDAVVVEHDRIIGGIKAL